MYFLDTNRSTYFFHSKQDVFIFINLCFKPKAHFLNLIIIWTLIHIFSRFYIYLCIIIFYCIICFQFPRWLFMLLYSFVCNYCGVTVIVLNAKLLSNGKCQVKSNSSLQGSLEYLYIFIKKWDYKIEYLLFHSNPFSHPFLKLVPIN